MRPVSVKIAWIRFRHQQMPGRFRQRWNGGRRLGVLHRRVPFNGEVRVHHWIVWKFHVMFHNFSLLGDSIPNFGRIRIEFSRIFPSLFIRRIFLPTCRTVVLIKGVEHTVQWFKLPSKRILFRINNCRLIKNHNNLSPLHFDLINYHARRTTHPLDR